MSEVIDLVKTLDGSYVAVSEVDDGIKGRLVDICDGSIGSVGVNMTYDQTGKVNYNFWKN